MTSSSNGFTVHAYMFEPIAHVRVVTGIRASADDTDQENVSQPATFTRIGNVDWFVLRVQSPTVFSDSTSEVIRNV